MQSGICSKIRVKAAERLGKNKKHKEEGRKRRDDSTKGVGHQDTTLPRQIVGEGLGHNLDKKIEHTCKGKGGFKGVCEGLGRSKLQEGKTEDTQGNRNSKQVPRKKNLRGCGSTREQNRNNKTGMG